MLVRDDIGRLHLSLKLKFYAIGLDRTKTGFEAKLRIKSPVVPLYAKSFSYVHFSVTGCYNVDSGYAKDKICCSSCLSPFVVIFQSQSGLYQSQSSLFQWLDPLHTTGFLRSGKVGEF